MKAVTQTNLTLENGNCIQAAVASIVGLPIDQVPDFRSHGDAWLYDLIVWCAKHGLRGRFTRNKYAIAAHRGVAMVQGQTKRGTLHAVVFNRGYLMHDPHPSRAGLTSVENAVLFG